MARTKPFVVVPEELRAQMARLARHRFRLLPLGGSDGKSPILRNWSNGVPSLGQLLGPMYAYGSHAYGIRLDDLTVIDCDFPDPDLFEKIEARFGASHVHVETPRGLHLYYASGPFRPNLRREGLSVDLKTGASSYVVGPGSLRPNGGEYVMVRGDLCRDQLHPLKDPQRPRQVALVSPCIEEGEWNRALTKMAVALARVVETDDELLAALLAARDARCEKPESMPDAEVVGIAEWAWRKRCENSLYTNRHSEFRVPREAMDRLKGKPAAEDACGAPGPSRALSGQDIRSQLRRHARSRSRDHLRAAVSHGAAFA